MKQASLFDPPIAHTGDPETSHEAADKHEQSGRRDAHCRVVLAMVRRHPGATACELWELSDAKGELNEMQEVRRRLTDLLHRRAVRQGEARPCMVRGSKMVTWYAI